MRTLILVVFTCFVLTLGFLAYWWTQPANSKTLRKTEKGDTALPLQARQTDKPYGPGQNVWVKKYDADTAKLVSRFRADDYQPRNDGWVTVKQPRAQFFLNDGRAISVEGESGEVIMDDNSKTGMKALAGSRDTPSRSRHHVDAAPASMSISSHVAATARMGSGMARPTRRSRN